MRRLAIAAAAHVAFATLAVAADGLSGPALNDPGAFGRPMRAERHDRAIETADFQLDRLKGQLAEVEVTIKRLMNEIQRLRAKEDREAQRAQEAEELISRLEIELTEHANKLQQIREAALP